MASEISTSQTPATPTPPPTTPSDPQDVDDGLMSSQRQRYLMALEEEGAVVERQSDIPRPAR
jgi:hypothetical protein